ncbi:hypothetical protein [Halorhabdus sp. SVX81]|uniref:hypothetical protein n=1 Tax=Halorhabdus sp. SVX81 TaxID=2978283 RepID=UPI0023DCEB24|nr:hypothetical protein [Halorhabdus sp. SVX81]
MERTALQRTIRRGIAVLLIPISLYPMMFVARMDDNRVAYNHPALGLGYDIALLIFIGATLYFLGSILIQSLSSIQDSGQGEPISD